MLTPSLTASRSETPLPAPQLLPVAAESLPVPADPMAGYQHLDGLYFGLPSENYHRDPALGAGDIKRLLCHPAAFYEVWSGNPRATATADTPARQRGRALHKLLLEGQDAFEAAYRPEPTPADAPGCLVTASDLSGFCKEKGIAGYSGKKKEEVIALIKKHDHKVLIWDEFKANFQRFAAEKGLEVLKAEVMADITATARAVTLNPHLKAAFQGGASEVSVFWTGEDRVRCKARIDYLKARAIVDLKSFSNARELPVDVALVQAIQTYRYDLQARHYLDGYAAMLDLIGQGKVFGTCTLPQGWEDKLAAPEDLRWIWVFLHADVPIAEGIEIASDSGVLNRAAREVPLARRVFAENLEFFGKNAPWCALAPIRVLQDSDLAGWMREGLDEEAA